MAVPTHDAKPSKRPPATVRAMTYADAWSRRNRKDRCGNEESQNCHCLGGEVNAASRRGTILTRCTHQPNFPHSRLGDLEVLFGAWVDLEPELGVEAHRALVADDDP